MRPRRLAGIRWAFVLATALTLASMLRYPGGTPLDPTATHYLPLHNFLSDLGMTVSYSGQPNRLGALLFVVGLLCLIAGATGLLLELVRLCSTSARARRLVRASAVIALASCLAFVGVAFTPENRVMSLHLDFTLLAFRTAPIATLLLTFAARASDVLPRRVTLALAALTAFLMAYVGVLEWGPPVLTPRGLVTQVVAQKAVACSALVTFLGLSLQVERVRTRMRPAETAARARA